jgi:hypothetical protein
MGNDTHLHARESGSLRHGTPHASFVAVMKTALLVSASLVALSTTASAGGYVGLALGTQPAVNDDLEDLATPNGRSLRGLGGFRFGNVSVEGAVNGFGVVTGRGEHNVYQLSVAAKLNLPLGNGFEAFGRAGLERTWLNLDDDRYNMSGDGYLVGAGFEYRLDFVLTSASIFVDYTIHRATLEDGAAREIDATTRVWGLGVAIGI